MEIKEIRLEEKKVNGKIIKILEDDLNYVCVVQKTKGKEFAYCIVSKTNEKVVKELLRIGSNYSFICSDIYAVSTVIGCTPDDLLKE